MFDFPQVTEWNLWNSWSPYGTDTFYARSDLVGG